MVKFSSIIEVQLNERKKSKKLKRLESDGNPI